MKIKNKIIEFVKKETVLTAAMVLAVLSAVMIPPDTEYIGYIDFRTLAILFCLMTVMAGLQKLGIFRRVAKILLQHTHNVIALAEILVLLCFFFSMLITNDVALITFVPFTFTVLHLSGEDAVRKLAVPVVVLQTIAANLGSMLTPIGNPQNLYLYGKIQMSPIAFIRLMLPYSTVSLFLLLICTVVAAKHSGIAVRDVAGALQAEDAGQETAGWRRHLSVFYLILFLLCLLTVAHVIPYPVTLGIVVLGVGILDRTTIGKVDYSLLLSGFTENVEALIVGTNLGGLGTLIASMASLISYKQVASQIPGEKKRYFGWFTVVNVGFLFLLLFINGLL